MQLRTAAARRELLRGAARPTTSMHQYDIFLHYGSVAQTAVEPPAFDDTVLHVLPFQEVARRPRGARLRLDLLLHLVRRRPPLVRRLFATTLGFTQLMP